MFINQPFEESSPSSRCSTQSPAARNSNLRPYILHSLLTCSIWIIMLMCVGGEATWHALSHPPGTIPQPLNTGISLPSTRKSWMQGGPLTPPNNGCFHCQGNRFPPGSLFSFVTLTQETLLTHYISDHSCAVFLSRRCLGSLLSWDPMTCCCLFFPFFLLLSIPLYPFLL